MDIVEMENVFLRAIRLFLFSASYPLNYHPRDSDLHGKQNFRKDTF